MGVTLPPLCIIQARYHSTRLRGKMLRTLPHRREYLLHSGPAFGDWEEETLIARAFRIARAADFDVVVAIPATDAASPLGEELRRLHADIFAWNWPEADVLGRFHACAHHYRWHPDSVIVRYTPDDPFKSPASLKLVAEGRRLPVEVGGEAFTLAMLDAAWRRLEGGLLTEREHITHALFPTAPPPPPPGVWTIDTEADLEAARGVITGQA